MKDTASAKSYFDRDVYAVDTTGIVIEEARPDYARCTLEADARHLNAKGTVMGGALFTLADYTFAVAANTEETDAVSLTCAVTYHAPAFAGKLTAEASCLKAGRRVSSFLVRVTDGAGRLIATVSSTGMRTPRETKSK